VCFQPNPLEEREKKKNNKKRKKERKKAIHQEKVIFCLNEKANSTYVLRVVQLTALGTHHFAGKQLNCAVFQRKGRRVISAKAEYNSWGKRKKNRAGCILKKDCCQCIVQMQVCILQLDPALTKFSHDRCPAVGISLRYSCVWPIAVVLFQPQRQNQP
jgi:hypothetical protein